MKGVVALVGAVAAMTHDADIKLFNEWMGTHGKTYETDVEELARFKVFKANTAFITAHNMKKDTSYTLGHNQFADMTNEEYRSLRRSAIHRSEHTDTAFKAHGNRPPPLPPAPRSVDYRTKGYVTPVKNEGGCNAPWAYAAVASLEGAYAMMHGASKLTNFSVQEVLDCGGRGCDGGSVDGAIDFMWRAQQLYMKGLCTDAGYPFTTGRNETCKLDTNPPLPTPRAIVEGLIDQRGGNETILELYIAFQGPVFTAKIDASHKSFQFYASGIYNEPACSSTVLDHAVAIVGYHNLDDNAQNYWIVKNSWGTTWGDSGYILMSKDNNNQCGIATHNVLPMLWPDVKARSGV